MTTATLLSGRPLVEIGADGLRVLARDLVVDLGQHVLELGEVDGVEHSIRSTVVTVPAGFVYDGASLPWWSRPVLGPDERWECAGLCHDWCYRRQAQRAASDFVFWLIARSGSRHTGPVRGALGWAGLRVGGWWAYRRYSR